MLLFLNVCRSWPSFYVVSEARIWAAATRPGKLGYAMALSPCKVPLELSRVGTRGPKPLRLQFALLICLFVRLEEETPTLCEGALA